MFAGRPMGSVFWCWRLKRMRPERDDGSGLDKFRECAVDPAANIVAAGERIVLEAAAFNRYFLAGEPGGPGAISHLGLVVIVEQVGVDFIFIFGFFDHDIVNEAELA